KTPFLTLFLWLGVSSFFLVRHHLWGVLSNHVVVFLAGSAQPTTIWRDGLVASTRNAVWLCGGDYCGFFINCSAKLDRASECKRRPARVAGFALGVRQAIACVFL